MKTALLTLGLLAISTASYAQAPATGDTMGKNNCQDERFTLVMERDGTTCASGIAEEHWSYATYMDDQRDPIDTGVLTFFCRDGYKWAYLAGQEWRKMRLDRIGGSGTRYRLSQVGFFIANLQCHASFE